jgi:hypothetical protein
MKNARIMPDALEKIATEAPASLFDQEIELHHHHEKYEEERAIDIKPALPLHDEKPHESYRQEHALSKRHLYLLELRPILEDLLAEIESQEGKKTGKGEEESEVKKQKAAEIGAIRIDILQDQEPSRERDERTEDHSPQVSSESHTFRVIRFLMIIF